MKLIPALSDTIKGILLIIGGTILLLNTLGVTTELMHSIILFGSIGMIILGFFMANIHKGIMSLIRKKESPKPPENQQSQNPQSPYDRDDNDHQQF